MISTISININTSLLEGIPLNRAGNILKNFKTVSNSPKLYPNIKVGYNSYTKVYTFTYVRRGKETVYEYIILE